MIQTPVFFISHGAPTFALEPGKLGANLNALGKELSGVRAVLVVSPHWQTQGLRVMANKSPATLHDFGGFPRELYDLQYPAPGHPSFAAEAGQLLVEAGFKVSLDDKRGLDHGAWVPLRHLLPAADVPVFQVSMPHALDAAGAHLAIAYGPTVVVHGLGDESSETVRTIASPKEIPQAPHSTRMLLIYAFPKGSAKFNLFYWGQKLLGWVPHHKWGYLSDEVNRT